MNNLIGILVGLLLTTAQSNQEITEQSVDNQQQLNQKTQIQQVQGITFSDPYCKTPQLNPNEVKEIIQQTQTMNLNFVALAEAESGLYNLSKKPVSTGSDNYYRGIFQIYDKYHKLDDYCSPSEQVKWLERKIREGAKPERLFPNLYQKLYE